jgi:hypothetical protein
MQYPGCVKTRRRSIAIEQVTRSRPVHVPTSQAHSILKSKSRISFSSRFELLSFPTAWVIFDQFSDFAWRIMSASPRKRTPRWWRQKATASYNTRVPCLAVCLASCPARAFLQGKQQGNIRLAIASMVARCAWHRASVRRRLPTPL